MRFSFGVLWRQSMIMLQGVTRFFANKYGVRGVLEHVKLVESRRCLQFFTDFSGRLSRSFGLVRREYSSTDSRVMVSAQSVGGRNFMGRLTGILSVGRIFRAARVTPSLGELTDSYFVGRRTMSGLSLGPVSVGYIRQEV